MLNQRCAGFLLSALCTTIVAAPATAQTDQVARIIQTNSAGTNAHIIDPETHEVLAVVEGVPHVHGVAEHPEGLYYYFSNEMHSTIDVVDTRTLEVVDRIPLSGRPNNVSISKELRKLYGGGDYAHNGPRRWTSMDDPEWQMLAAWVRGERTGTACSS
jgi:YVTN family beta-propeller protein